MATIGPSTICNSKNSCELQHSKVSYLEVLLCMLRWPNTRGNASTMYHVRSHSLRELQVTISQCFISIGKTNEISRISRGSASNGRKGNQRNTKIDQSTIVRGQPQSPRHFGLSDSRSESLFLSSLLCIHFVFNILSIRVA